MSNKKILILDDDKVLLDELSESLALNGYEPVAVDDTQGFMDVAAKIKPDVILLDLKMPKKTGFLVALELKESSECCLIPVVAMSSFIKRGETPPAELTNIKACLKKPFSPQDLIELIEKVLR